ncbi:MAG: CoA transferase [Proteobacteria bacterium]|nr:CoA transferase [Pseudomonadota bacterium]MBU1452723.1 CoA transferase [Pseudomonadota bacterium]MBU2467863.1 CoA transferase [Pseudomonadota bacterium]MBU2519402.1 CoA transferase [Pseudomonadota bacterium]
MNTLTPLKQIKVLDLTALLPGPYCTMLLATLGAQVIKVENPKSGDLMRVMSPGAFRYLNGQKDLLCLDLKNPRGRKIFLDLAAGCDVLVEGFRPGVAARLGVDFESVAKVNGSIIYCTLSGYGHSGPYSNLPGHDINYMGVAGLLSISGDPSSGKPESPSGPQYSDLAGSLFGANAILAALVGRGESREAQFLDVSLAESTAMLMMPRYLDYLEKGRPPKREFMARGPYGVFETRDGRFLTLGIVEDHFWANFCQVVGWSDLAADPELRGWDARNRQAERLKPLLEEIFKSRDLREWLEVLTAADVPVAPVHGLDEWTQDPQFLARGFFKSASDAAEQVTRMPHFPVPGLGRSAQDSPREMPLGRDTEKWLLAKGLDPKEIESLREQRVI